MHLYDGNKTVEQLSELMNVKINEIEQRIKIVMFYNIVIKSNLEYQYVEPYGNVDCDDSIPETNNINLEYNKFTDVIMTTESRIVKEVKSGKILKMELERKIQEFLGSAYTRTIFYSQLESLKKRYYIEEKDDCIEYVI
jgi:hypothetical protein